MTKGRQLAETALAYWRAQAQAVLRQAVREVEIEHGALAAMPFVAALDALREAKR